MRSLKTEDDGELHKIDCFAMAAILKKQLKTRFYAPTLALTYVAQCGYTDSVLERDYQLTRPTLAKIRRGEAVPRSEAHYLGLMVGILNNERRGCGYRSDDVAWQARWRHSDDWYDLAMRNLLLVMHGIPTDAELMALEQGCAGE